MSSEASWAVIGAICGIAVAGAWAWFSTARQIDCALTEAINRRPWMAQEARRLILTEFA